MQILIVDDYAPFTRSLELMLAPDHAVTTASDGRSAVELLERRRDFDLLLVDVEMPEITGVDVYEFLRAHAPDVAQRVVFMTGGVHHSVLSQALRLLANTRLEKPFREGELRAVMSRFERAA